MEEIPLYATILFALALAVVQPQAPPLAVPQDDYAQKSAASIAQKVPLVVFVGVPARPIEGAIVCHKASMPNLPAKCVIVAKSDGRVLHHCAPGDSADWHLPPDASDAAISRWAGVGVSQPAAPFSATADGKTSVSGQEALNEVNATRAQRGLRPYAHDPNLSVAALSAAQYRAARRLAGHTPSDFAHLPPGTDATAAGCAAWPPGLGWGACCTYENWTTAGAAIVIGPDGQRYMHLFVR